MSDTFLGIQPIFDRDQHIIAYELLFRGLFGGFEDDPIDPDAATSQVILNAFTDIGVERLGRDKLLFLNLTEGLLKSDLIRTLPPDRVVLEILETVRITPALVESARSLVGLGFTLALDDFVYSPEWDPLLEIARIVKFDVLGDDRAAITAKLASLPRTCRPRLLAEKIETHEQFQDCLGLGFDLFQGYHLARPEVLAGKRPPANHVQALRLLARLQDDDIGLQEVERIISQDVTLSYRLLRFIGNVAVSQARPIQTMMQAISLVGLRTVRQWAALLTLGSLDSVNPYSFTRSLTYARFCQIVGERRFSQDKDALFTVGLFSNLDEILLIPLHEALEHLPLDLRIKQAILEHKGLLGAVLAYAKGFEDDERSSDESLPGLDAETLAVYFLEAFAWARDLQQQVETGDRDAHDQERHPPRDDLRARSRPRR
ncbi:EAL and HDOD domain-containing protein [Allochromatium tepidum]|uniref:Histidine kinase n=1 Tax=Allochromatium tepidum TaxID=553982 RepID=A0ABM7QK12_9GAMM|nr:HDOD domain-containing protein [Allochromatium tepidum]BCU06094.1 histidine kinase [Allochromatium tepidum]